MIDDRLRGTIEVRDEEISEELYWLVKENLRKRGGQLIQFDPQVDDFFGSGQAGDAETRVRNAIDRADASQSSVKVGIQLRPAKSIMDVLLERVRRPLHQLVVFYVGLMADKQKVFNAHAISALRLLLEIATRQGKEAGAQGDAELRREAAELRREAAQLRAEVERLSEQIRRLEDMLQRPATERREGAESTDEAAPGGP